MQVDKLNSESYYNRNNIQDNTMTGKTLRQAWEEFHDLQGETIMD
jgi:hypothetical protein